MATVELTGAVPSPAADNAGRGASAAHPSGGSVPFVPHAPPSAPPHGAAGADDRHSVSAASSAVAEHDAVVISDHARAAAAAPTAGAAGGADDSEVDPHAKQSATHDAAPASASAPPEKEPLGCFGKYLSVWVLVCIIAGVLLGRAAPGAFTAIADAEVARVNLPIAVLIFVMVYPMMVNIDLGELRRVSERPGGLLLTISVNWLVKPFSMAGIAALFMRVLYKDLVSEDDAQQYIAGMVLLGVAPCTAMVFVWSQLAKGDPNYTLVQVTLNDTIMLFAFAPIAGLLLGVTDVEVPWDTLVWSVVLFVAVPLTTGALTRRWLRSRGGDALVAFNARASPVSIAGLLLTVATIFGLQADTMVDRPGVIGLIAVPLLLQTYAIFALTYSLAWAFALPYDVAAPASFIGTSNFFELAVAVAIALFGVSSGAALATVVGVLVEVPVMLTLVSFANWTRPLMEARQRARPNACSRVAGGGR